MGCVRVSGTLLPALRLLAGFGINSMSGNVSISNSQVMHCIFHAYSRVNLGEQVQNKLALVLLCLQHSSSQQARKILAFFISGPFSGQDFNKIYQWKLDFQLSRASEFPPHTTPQECLHRME